MSAAKEKKKQERRKRSKKASKKGKAITMASMATSSGSEASAATSSSSETGGSGVDNKTKATVSKIPLCSINAGPRDGDEWKKRMKQEVKALIAYIKNNKASDQDWFTIKPNPTGTFWSGTCWYYYKSIKYQFNIQFDTPATYPAAAPEIAIPELDGKTAKMYRGGKICLTLHFNPLWRKNVPRFGIAHALALGLGPWLAAEVPDLVEKGLIQAK